MKTSIIFNPDEFDFWRPFTTDAAAVDFIKRAWRHERFVITKERVLEIWSLKKMRHVSFRAVDAPAIPAPPFGLFDVMPDQSPEPTAIGAVSSAIAGNITSWRWISFHR